jgi:hypothetical protein
VKGKPMKNFGKRLPALFVTGSSAHLLPPTWMF